MDALRELRELGKSGKMVGDNSSLSSEFFLTISELDVSHAFCVEKLLKSGIKDLKILTEQGPQNIGDVSNIQHALETDAKLFPPFFVFILPKQGKPVNISLIRDRFGRYLFEELSKFITQETTTKYVSRNRKKRKAAPPTHLQIKNLHRG